MVNSQSNFVAARLDRTEYNAKVRQPGKYRLIDQRRREGVALDKTKFLAALTLALIFVGPATAGTVWNEAINGDLSDNPLAPTVVSFAPGPNDVIGQAGNAVNSPLGVDQDFFTFTVPTGYSLTSLIPISVVFQDPSDNASFLGLQSGSQITVNVLPPFTDATGLLGWRHVDPSDNGTNILPAMGVADFGATGFTGPLSAGPYSVWIQDDHPVDYVLRFNISPVPEPSTVLLMLTGLAALMGMRLYRRRT
jgi:hypothetical protein